MMKAKALPQAPQACCTLDLNPAEQKRMVTMFKALGNPIRFEIMKYLLTHSGCLLGHVVEALPISQATVSQHIKVLKESGWIQRTSEGTASLYHLNEETINWFRSKVGNIF